MSFFCCVVVLVVFVVLFVCGVFFYCLLLTAFSAEVILLWMNYPQVQYLKSKLFVFAMPKLLLKLPCEDISMHLRGLSSCSLWCGLYAHLHVFSPLQDSPECKTLQKINSKSLWLVTDGSLFASMLYCSCGNGGIWMGKVNL